jgi:hypothetical protein
MPNHVYQTATITGPADVIATLTTMAQEGQSIIKHYVPLPDDATKEVTHTNPDGTTTTYSAFSDNGYNTALELWGTKWADYDIDLINSTPTELNIRFQSAWSPAIEGWRKVSEMTGINLLISYEEEGCGFIGACYIANGTVVADKWYDDGEIDTALAALGFDAVRYPEPEDDENEDYDDRLNAYFDYQHESRQALLNNVTAMVSDLVGRMN